MSKGRSDKCKLQVILSINSLFWEEIKAYVTVHTAMLWMCAIVCDP